VALATNTASDREVDPEVFIQELHHFAQHPLHREEIAWIKDLLDEKDLNLTPPPSWDRQ
jgi:hypothetical protein